MNKFFKNVILILPVLFLAFNFTNVKADTYQFNYTDMNTQSSSYCTSQQPVGTTCHPDIQVIFTLNANLYPLYGSDAVASIGSLIFCVGNSYSCYSAIDPSTSNLVYNNSSSLRIITDHNTFKLRDKVNGNIYTITNYPFPGAYGGGDLYFNSSNGFSRAYNNPLNTNPSLPDQLRNYEFSFEFNPSIQISAGGYGSGNYVYSQYMGPKFIAKQDTQLMRRQCVLYPTQTVNTNICVNNTFFNLNGTDYTIGQSLGGKKISSFTCNPNNVANSVATVNFVPENQDLCPSTPPQIFVK